MAKTKEILHEPIVYRVALITVIVLLIAAGVGIFLTSGLESLDKLSSLAENSPYFFGSGLIAGALFTALFLEDYVRERFVVTDKIRRIYLIVIGAQCGLALIPISADHQLQSIIHTTLAVTHVSFVLYLMYEFADENSSLPRIIRRKALNIFSGIVIIVGIASLALNKLLVAQIILYSFIFYWLLTIAFMKPKQS